MISTLCAVAGLLQPATAAEPEFLRRPLEVAWALPVWLAWDPCLPYFTAVLVLVLGSISAARKASLSANWMDRVVLFGPVFIAAPMAVFGTEHYLDPSGVGRIIPAWIPAHLFWVYLVGTFLIVGGLSIAVQKYVQLSMGLFGVMLLCFEGLMHIPRVVAAPHNRLTWALAFRDFFFSCGALSFAAMGAPEREIKAAPRLFLMARIGIAIALLFFATQYFFHPELLPGIPLRQVTPKFIPGQWLWGGTTGVIYLVAGLCVLVEKETRLVAASLGLFVLFATIFFCFPIMIVHLAEIGRGLNVVADTLLLSGAILCLGWKYSGHAAVNSERLSSRSEQDRFGRVPVSKSVDGKER